MFRHMKAANILLDKIEEAIYTADADTKLVNRSTQDDGSPHALQENINELVNVASCVAAMDRILFALASRIQNPRSSWNTINKSLEILGVLMGIDQIYQSSQMYLIRTVISSKQNLALTGAAPKFVKASLENISRSISQRIQKREGRSSETGSTHYLEKEKEILREMKINRGDGDEFDQFVCANPTAQTATTSHSVTSDTFNIPSPVNCHDLNHQTFPQQTTFFNQNQTIPFASVPQATNAALIPPINFQSPTIQQLGLQVSNHEPIGNFSPNTNFMSPNSDNFSPYPSSNMTNNYPSVQSNTSSWDNLFQPGQMMPQSNPVHCESIGISGISSSPQMDSNSNSLHYMKIYGSHSRKKEGNNSDAFDSFIKDTMKKF